MKHLLSCPSSPLLSGLPVTTDPLDACDPRPPMTITSHNDAVCWLAKLEREAVLAKARYDRALAKLKTDVPHIEQFAANRIMCVAWVEVRDAEGRTTMRRCRYIPTRRDGRCEEHGDAVDAELAEQFDRIIGNDPDLMPRSSFAAMEQREHCEKAEHERQERAAKRREAERVEGERRAALLAAGPRIRHT